MPTTRPTSSPTSRPSRIPTSSWRAAAWGRKRATSASTATCARARMRSTRSRTPRASSFAACSISCASRSTSTWPTASSWCATSRSRRTLRTPIGSRTAPIPTSTSSRRVAAPTASPPCSCTCRSPRWVAKRSSRMAILCRTRRQRYRASCTSCSPSPARGSTRWCATATRRWPCRRRSCRPCCSTRRPAPVRWIAAAHTEAARC
mmetsp:Transcript_28127/g.68363  ORF Transcript_28127/g.68363 Transcript_28127/m.68363 type:complete len:205 (-) Transcript_28127:472-1086(-)